MSKKVNLNAPPKNNNNVKKHKTSRPVKTNQSNNNANNNQSGNATNEKPKKNYSKLRKKATEAALNYAGVPQGVSNQLANNDKFQAFLDKGKFFMMLPAPVQIFVFGFLILAILMIFIMFVVIFKDDLSGGGSGTGGGDTVEYGTTCTKVTVENTGCDSNGDNCTHEYDGEISVEDYIAGVVAGTSDGTNNLEYYKTIAIEVRTNFYDSVSDSCTVDGSTPSQEYMDVDDSSDAALIKQAVEETKNEVIIKNDSLVSTSDSTSATITSDDTNYYIEYNGGSEDAKTLQIPKTWDSEAHAYSGYLAGYVSGSNQDTEDNTLNKIGILYMTTNLSYSSADAIEFCYGSESSVVANSMKLGSVEGFSNPTSKIYCSSPFGTRTHPVSGKTESHSGVDIAIAGGEPIYAANDGIITYIRSDITGINSCSYGYGNHIIIDHGDGMTTLYAHMKYGSIPEDFEVGTSVSQGEQIGAVGSTGCSTGNHLHYEVRVNNEKVDPTNYMDLSQASGQCTR